MPFRATGASSIFATSDISRMFAPTRAANEASISKRSSRAPHGEVAPRQTSIERDLNPRNNCFADSRVWPLHHRCIL